MVSRYQYHGGVWVDLEHPDEKEIQEVVKEFSIGERLEAELFSPTPTPLVANDSNVTFLVLHFPTRGEAEGEIKDQEVDFIVGDHFIITVRYEVIASLYRLKKILEAEHALSPRNGLTTDVLLEILFAHLYTAVRDHINIVVEHLSRIEHAMFSGLERTTVRPISNLSREFLHTEASLANQEEPLTRFLKACEARRAFGNTFSERAERILAERAQVARFSSTYRAVARELRETNASLLEATQNQIMKNLTVITFGVLPLELIALVFGMHELGTPFEGRPDAFWIILLIMIAVGAVMIIFFSRKRWLA